MEPCGVQYAATDGPPKKCIICEGERQYIGWNGRQWTTLADMKVADYQKKICRIAH